ncbi:signal transduction histidine kinase [Cytobacillus eiseniae]|uniref:histidine kinase n=1 Tax=Cytobacillus eiseniae TaxID=762947 RepID=A0ABS4RDG8_9BACI|nr:histidine kinase [Cytobacillus eiseniae]MBP2240940.1 signal transduction histidine kinase [Cytobacillus eiseniae]
MKSYWLWLFLNIIVWLLAVVYFNEDLDNLTIRLFGVTFYFIQFFIIPITIRKTNLLVIILSINALLASISLLPYDNGGFNPFLILIISLLIAEGFYRLSIGRSMIVGVIGTFGLIANVLYSNLDPFVQLFIGIYIILLIIAMIFYKKTKNRSDDLEARYQALLSEYRDLKRRVISEEDLARQEERVLIAHEIHDSVGHTLTALLMQLEMFRLNISGEYKEQVQTLKELANSSLEKTRNAVKSLKARESGGLPGILRLVRKLEMESFIRIHFSVKHGAFTAPLTGEQSFVIYRSVQEALTNIMKHSQAREAEITFEAPGGSIFRFEISNPVIDNHRYQEGFGLTSMRERLVKFGGNLEVFKTEEQFVVTGFIRIGYEGLE